jgi:hypothetical protein
MRVWVVDVHDGRNDGGSVVGVFASIDAARGFILARWPEMLIDTVGDGLKGTWVKGLTDVHATAFEVIVAANMAVLAWEGIKA